MATRERVGSMRDHIRRMVIRDLEITTKKILESLRPRDGAKVELPSVFMVDSLRNDTRQTIRLLKDLGYLDAAYERKIGI